MFCKLLAAFVLMSGAGHAAHAPAAAGLGVPAARSIEQARSPEASPHDLDGQPVDALAAPGAKAVVLLFTTVECPIANRYAPELRRLYERYEKQDVRFWLVYPNPADTAVAIRAHLRSYGYPMAALRDPGFSLVRTTGATVTPEAALFVPSADAGGGAGGRARLVYRGRIDDRFVDVGVDRQTPARRDLEDAIAAVLAGKPVRESTTRAVGCILADFAR